MIMMKIIITIMMRSTMKKMTRRRRNTKKRLDKRKPDELKGKRKVSALAGRHSTVVADLSHHQDRDRVQTVSTLNLAGVSVAV